MAKSGRGGRSEKPGSVMTRLWQKLGLTKSYQTHQLFYDWERIVGRGIAQHVKPVRLDFHTLYLQADAPVWANQLVFMQEELLQRINGYAASHLVKEIRFGRQSFWQKPSPTREMDEAALKLQRAQAEPEPLPAASTEEIRQATSFCAELQDEALRMAVSKAVSRSLTGRRVKKQAGWHPCRQCGHLCPKGEMFCSVCQREQAKDLTRRLHRYLEIKPWATYSEVFEQFGCSPEQLREARVTLLQKWLNRLTYSRKDRASEGAKKLVMLYTSRAPEDISEELQEKILKKLRFDLRPMTREEIEKEKEKEAQKQS